MGIIDAIMIAVIGAYFWDLQSDGKLDLPHIDEMFLRRIFEILAKTLRH